MHFSKTIVFTYANSWNFNFTRTKGYVLGTWFAKNSSVFLGRLSMIFFGFSWFWRVGAKLQKIAQVNHKFITFQMSFWGASFSRICQAKSSHSLSRFQRLDINPIWEQMQTWATPGNTQPSPKPAQAEPSQAQALNFQTLTLTIKSKTKISWVLGFLSSGGLTLILIQSWTKISWVLEF